jgi:hypothetical protein
MHSRIFYELSVCLNYILKSGNTHLNLKQAVSEETQMFPNPV